MQYRSKCVQTGNSYPRTARETVGPDARSREVDWAKVMDTALNSPGQLGQTYSRFHRYSFLNQIMLLMQGAKGPVASYQRWQDLGRQVVKGSRGYDIVRPIQVKIRGDVPAGVANRGKPPEAENGDKPKTFTRFKVVRGAFTFSQTTGEELPEPEVPAWDFKRALGKLAISEVPFEHPDGNCQGYSFERNVAINPVAAFPVKTRFHEIAHVELGHTVREQQAEYVQHRGLKEFEAEGAAYLSLTELGLSEMFDPAESRAYIQHWMNGDTPPDSSIRRVFKVTSSILNAGYPEPAEAASA